jgi:hypothetical protein
MVLNTRAQLGYGDSYGSDSIRVMCCSEGSPPDSQRKTYTDADCAPGTTPADRVRGHRPAVLRELLRWRHALGARFRDNTLGPVDFATGSSFRQPIGGAVKTAGSLEMYFPALLDTPAARISAFVDVGNVYKDIDSFDVGELRAIAGVALLWRAPVGPISISYAFADAQRRHRRDRTPAVHLRRRVLTAGALRPVVPALSNAPCRRYALHRRRTGRALRAGNCAATRSRDRRRRHARACRLLAARVPRQSALPQPTRRERLRVLVVMREDDAEDLRRRCADRQRSLRRIREDRGAVRGARAARAGRASERRDRPDGRDLADASIGPFVSIGARSGSTPARSSARAA